MLNLRSSIAFFLALFGCSPIRAQQAQANCAAMEYEHHNQIDPKAHSSEVDARGVKAIETLAAVTKPRGIDDCSYVDLK